MGYRWFVIARVLHVVAVVVWIGGIGAVTTVVFPAMRRIDSDERRVWLFDQVEDHFRPQAQISWLVVGITGFYMVAYLGAWERFGQGHYWWMSAMVALWVLFGLMLFIIEPFVFGPKIRQRLLTEPKAALARIETMHWVLLILSLFVIGVVVAGIYGLL